MVDYFHFVLFVLIRFEIIILRIQKRNQNEPYMISPALVCDDFTIYPMRRRCSINFISWSKYISSICFEAAVRDFFNEETEDHRCSCDPEERKYCWSNAWYDDTKANSCKYNECEPDGWKWQRIKTYYINPVTKPDSCGRPCHTFKK